MNVKKKFIMCALILYIFPLIEAQTNSNRLFSLEEVLSALGASVEFRWDPFFQRGVFLFSEQYAVFQTGNPGETGITIINGREILAPPAPFIEKGQLRFPEAFVTSLKRGLQNAMHDDHLFRIAAIIIDPGHGGRDVGAVGNHTLRGRTVRLFEKDITLKVSKDLYDLLLKEFPGKKILLTRNTDIFVSLDDRVKIANSVSLKENEAIIFISVHTNASLTKSVRGYEIWYLKPDHERSIIDQSKYEDSKELIPILEAMLQDEFLTESTIIANSILRQFEETLGRTIPSRGIKEGEWFVVRNSRMPAILVELGFITNEADALLLSDDAYLKKFSEALYKGIRDFILDFENSRGYTIVE